jgi:hypothetical protein
MYIYTEAINESIEHVHDMKPFIYGLQWGGLLYTFL